MTKEILTSTQDYLDIAGVMIVVIKPDQTVELINKKGCEVLGYAKEEIEGKNWFDLFVPQEEREEIRINFMHMLQSDLQPSEFYENPIVTRENEVRFIQWHNAYLKNEFGEVVAILSSGEDITYRKILQSRLSALEAEKRKQILAAVLEAQENERHEIAYELHDNVNQILTTCKILLENEITGKPASTFVTNSYRYLQNAIDEIRNLSHRLNPAQLEEIGLENSVKELIRRLNTTGKFEILLKVNDSKLLRKIDYHISLSLFRIIQEQLNNIIKYAKASVVTIEIDLSNNSIDVQVCDNGVGFNIKEVKKGLGLKNIRNRAEFHRGHSYISSMPGEGCILSVCIPLNEL